MEALLTFLNKPLSETLGLLALFILGAMFIVYLILKVVSLAKSGIDFKLGSFQVKGTNKVSEEQKGAYTTMELMQQMIVAKDAEIEELRTKVIYLEDKLKRLETIMQTYEVTKKVKREMYKQVPMDKHIVFSNLQKIIKRGIDFGEVEDIASKNKIKVASIFIQQCKVKVFYDNLLIFVEELEELDSKGEEVKAIEKVYTIEQKIYDWIAEYNEKAKDIVYSIDGQPVVGIPDVFLREFDKWHQPHIDLTLEKIQSTLSSNFYYTWEIKIIMVMEHLDTAFKLTTQDAIFTIANINGELDKAIQEKLGKLN